jgi:hypothetical protein
VLAVVRHSHSAAAEVAELLVREFRRHNLSTETLFLKAENCGAQERAVR